MMNMFILHVAIIWQRKFLHPKVKHLTKDSKTHTVNLVIFQRFSSFIFIDTFARNYPFPTPSHKKPRHCWEWIPHLDCTFLSKTLPYKKAERINECWENTCVQPLNNSVYLSHLNSIIKLVIIHKSIQYKDILV